MNQPRNKIINLKMKITNEYGDVTYTVVDYNALTILIHHILDSQKIPNGRFIINVTTNDTTHCMPETQREALARTAVFFGKNSFIPYLDNLGNEIAQLYKYKTGDDFPMLNDKTHKMYGCLTEIVLTQCAHLVNKKPEEIKKMTVAGFVTGKKIIEVYKKGAIFKEDANPMHGVSSHHIHCGWLTAFFSEIGLSKEMQYDFYTNYFIRSAEKGAFVRDRTIVPFEYAFDIELMHSSGKDVLCSHCSPMVLNDDLIKGNFEEHYPHKQGIKVLTSYIRHRYFEKFYQSNQIMNGLCEYNGGDVVKIRPIDVYPPLHDRLRINSSPFPYIRHQGNNILIEYDLFEINNQYDKWLKKYHNDNQVTIKDIKIKTNPGFYDNHQMTFKRISPHDGKIHDMTPETAASRNRAVIKEKPMPKIETINKIQEIIQDVEKRPSSLLTQVNNQTMSRSSEEIPPCSLVV